MFGTLFNNLYVIRLKKKGIKTSQKNLTNNETSKKKFYIATILSFQRKYLALKTNPGPRRTT